MIIIKIIIKIYNMKQGSAGILQKWKVMEEF
jgi:hypothetical protein